MNSRNPSMEAAVRNPPARLLAGTCRVLLFLSLFFGIALCHSGEPAESHSDPPLRVAFSSRMFPDINESDARAAIKVWAQTLGRENGIPVDPHPRILTGVPDCVDAFRSNEVDAISMTIDEYLETEAVMPLGFLFGGLTQNELDVEYVILTHCDSKFERIEDLRGQRLVCLENPRMAMAQIWLDTELRERHCPGANSFFESLKIKNKLELVVLPVFFKSADACLVDRAGFKTMVELNPQLGKKLRVIASSQEILPVVFCFRADFSEARRDRLWAVFRQIHLSPAGQQILTVFHSERLVEVQQNALTSARNLMRRYRRFHPGNLAQTSSESADPKPALTP